MELIYIYDTYCGWCNVSRDNITKLYYKTKDTIKWKFLHLNLFNPSNIISITPDFLTMVKQVGSKIAVEKGSRAFSNSYFDLLSSPNFIHTSDTSSLAVASVELINKDLIIEYSLTLQEELFYKGMDINVDMVVKIAEQFGLNKDLFTKTLHSKQANDLRNTHIFLAKKYMIKSHKQGVPTLLLNNNDKLLILDPYTTNDI